MIYAPIEVTVTGVTELLPAAQHGYKISRIFFVSSAVTVVEFASGVTELTGPIELGAKGSFVLDEEFLLVEPGNAFLIVQTGTAVLGGAFAYDLYYG